MKTDVSLTYSPAVTLVPTNECFNLCTYCNFRRDPENARWLSLEAAQQTLSSLEGSGVSEILILSGEVHPKSRRRQDWFEHICRICQMALDAGFLPHSNVGPLTYDEMSRLATVNVSMGLMLEQRRQLLHVHEYAPSKDPKLRLQQLAWAGELHIPFTTGLLLGIGESEADWRQSLEAIADVHQRWGHIQEVIMQPYQPGSKELNPQNGLDGEDLVAAVDLARSTLPEAIAIQVPPNLIRQPTTLKACIDAGARDLGGLVPHDFVNPDYDHQSFDSFEKQLKDWGFSLQPRLPVYPQYYSEIDTPLRKALEPWQSGKRIWGYVEQSGCC